MKSVANSDNVADTDLTVEHLKTDASIDTSIILGFLDEHLFREALNVHNCTLTTLIVCDNCLHEKQGGRAFDGCSEGLRSVCRVVFSSPVGTNAAMCDGSFNVKVREFGGVHAGQVFQGASVLLAGVGSGHVA